MGSLGWVVGSVGARAYLGPRAAVWWGARDVMVDRSSRRVDSSRSVFVRVAIDGWVPQVLWELAGSLVILDVGRSEPKVGYSGMGAMAAGPRLCSRW